MTLTMALTIALVARLLSVIRVLSQVISALHPLHSSKACSIATTIGFLLCVILLRRGIIISAEWHPCWLRTTVFVWLLWIWRSLLSLRVGHQLSLEILLAILIDGIWIAIGIICTIGLWSHRGGVRVLVICCYSVL